MTAAVHYLVAPAFSKRFIAKIRIHRLTPAMAEAHNEKVIVRWLNKKS